MAPALVETALAAPLLRTRADRAFSETMHPTGRVGTPDDVAGAMAELPGPDDRWITGQVGASTAGWGRASRLPGRPRGPERSIPRCKRLLS